MITTKKTALDIGLEWLSIGVNVIPLQKGRKIPSLQSWREYQTKKVSEAEFRSWFSNNPNRHDLAVITGEISNLTVLDIDVAKDGSGRTGLDSLKEAGIQLPKENVLINRTSSGGYHLFLKYNHDLGTKAGLLEFIDVRNNGGYVKIHGDNRNEPDNPNSNKYERVRGEVHRDYFYDFNAEKLLEKSEPQSTQNTQSTMSVNKGNRNDSLARLSGKLLSLGVTDFNEMLAVATTVNNTYNPPLPEEEVRQVVKSISERYENRKSFNIKKGTYLMANKKKKQWVWEKWFPQGQITIVSGYEGKGKSYAMMDILSRITNGSIFPDGTQAPLGAVVYFGFEDGVYDDLPYRMEKCGTNPENFYVHDWEDSGTVSIEDERTQEEMLEVIKETNAKMVIIDPFRNLIPNVNDSKETIIGNILQTVSQIAKETNSSIVLIRHWGKDTQSKGTATHLQLGSVTYGARARSLINVIPIREDGEEDKNRKLWKQDKPSNSSFPDPFIFTIDDEGIRWEKAEEDVDTITSLGGGKNYLKEDCANAVLTILKNGAMDSGAVRETLLAEPYEYTRKTIKNAVSILSSDGRIKTKKLNTGHMIYALPEYSFDSLRPEGTEGTLEIGDIEV